MFGPFDPPQSSTCTNTADGSSGMSLNAPRLQTLGCRSGRRSHNLFAEFAMGLSAHIISDIIQLEVLY
jgi:hypothetical protein